MLVALETKSSHSLSTNLCKFSFTTRPPEGNIIINENVTATVTSQIEVMFSSELIPAKFLILVVHCIICILLLWNSAESTKACLPETAAEDAYWKYHTQLRIGLSVSIGMICFELLVFVTGLTMFYPTSGLLSIVCHAIGTIALACMVMDNLTCEWFWWIFALGSAIPLTNDVCTVFEIFLKQKY